MHTLHFRIGGGGHLGFTQIRTLLHSLNMCLINKSTALARDTILHQSAKFSLDEVPHQIHVVNNPSWVRCLINTFLTSFKQCTKAIFSYIPSSYMISLYMSCNVSMLRVPRYLSVLKVPMLKGGRYLSVLKVSVQKVPRYLSVLKIPRNLSVLKAPVPIFKLPRHRTVRQVSWCVATL